MPSFKGLPKFEAAAKGQGLGFMTDFFVLKKKTVGLAAHRRMPGARPAPRRGRLKLWRLLRLKPQSSFGQAQET
jgi:hypothetical protein